MITNLCATSVGRSETLIDLSQNFLDPLLGKGFKKDLTNVQRYTSLISVATATQQKEGTEMKKQETPKEEQKQSLQSFLNNMGKRLATEMKKDLPKKKA